MSNTERITKGNLTLLPGGLAGARELSPDEWFDREIRSLFASWKSEDGIGPYASRGIANTVHQINHPHRYLARRVKEARAKRVSHAKVRKLGYLVCEYVDRLYRTPGLTVTDHTNEAA